MQSGVPWKIRTKKFKSSSTRFGDQEVKGDLSVYIHVVEKDPGCILLRNEWQVRKRGRPSQVYKTHSRIWMGNGATESVSLQPDLWKVKPPIKVLVKSLSPPSFSLWSPWLYLPLLNSSRAFLTHYWSWYSLQYWVHPMSLVALNC